MSRRVQFMTTSRTAVLVGPGRMIVPSIKAVRSPRQWVGEVGGWAIPLVNLDEVLAHIQDRFGDDCIERVESVA